MAKVRAREERRRTLMLAAQRGASRRARDQAFSQLVKEFASTIGWVVGRYAGYLDVDDVRQIALTALWGAVRRYDPDKLGDGGSTLAYTTKWMRSSILDRLRHLYRRKRRGQRDEVSLDHPTPDGAAPPEPAVHDDGPRRVDDHDQLVTWWRAHGHRISPLERRVLGLWAGGHSYVEVAALLGEAEVTVTRRGLGATDRVTARRRIDRRGIDNALRRIKEKCARIRDETVPVGKKPKGRSKF